VTICVDPQAEHRSACLERANKWPCYVRKDTSVSTTLQESGRTEVVRTHIVEGSIMQSLTWNVERRLIGTSPLPIPAILLAGLAALNVVSAVLALLAA
jgi:hypothetical protein